MRRRGKKDGRAEAEAAPSLVRIKKFNGVLAYFPGFPAACCFGGFDTRGNFSLRAEILAFDVSAPR